MIVRKIVYDEKFKRQFLKLSPSVQENAAKAEELFRQNAFHPSLRLHKLKGKFKEIWSISIDRSNRIIFKAMSDGVVVFSSVGTHAIYND